MESSPNINRKVLSSLVLALRFSNIVIHFRQSANIKAIHSHVQKTRALWNPPRMSSAASCLPFHLSIVDINLQQCACLTIYSGIPKPKHFPNITRKIPNNLALV